MKKILFAAALAGAALLTACGSKSNGVQMGSLSEFDSLSYALGANVATGFSYQLRDVPFDWKAVETAMIESATGKSSFEKHSESVEKLREFFMTKRGERARAIAEKRAAADSARLAGGDTTKVEYPVADPEMFESEEERTEISQALGNDLGYGISQSEMPLQLVWIAQAMQDVRDGNAKMDEMEVNRYMQHYMMVTRPAENAAASKAWLEKKAKKSGAKTTESGLVYKIVKAGDETVKASDPRDVVKVQYTGRTRTGRVFDSSIFENLPEDLQEQRKQYMPDSYDKNEGVEFPLNRVIKGWTEGMQLVGKGGKIMLWIPSDLAYGPRGNRGIGPNEALEFEVEVLDVTPYVEPAPADSTAVAPAEKPAAEQTESK